MNYRWNHQAFGRTVGQVESADDITSCPVALDTLVASGMVTNLVEPGRYRENETEKGEGR